MAGIMPQLLRTTQAKDWLFLLAIF